MHELTRVEVVERKRLSCGGTEVGRPLLQARTFKEHDEQALQEIADVMGDETVLGRDRVSWLEMEQFAQTTKKPTESIKPGFCGRMHNSITRQQIWVPQVVAIVGW